MEGDVSIVYNFSVPSSFSEVKQMADKIVEKDKEFQDFLHLQEPRYVKKTKQNKYQSIKMRYYIIFFLKYRGKYLEEEENKEKEEESSEENNEGGNEDDKKSESESN